MRHNLIGRRHGPYYMTAPLSKLTARLLPKLKESLSPDIRSSTGVFPPPEDRTSITSWRASIRALLDYLGACLRPPSLMDNETRSMDDGDDDEDDDDTTSSSSSSFKRTKKPELMSGSDAYAYPPGASASLELRSCMLMDMDKIRRTPFVNVDNTGYVLVVLAYDSRGRPIQERAHRIVLWAMYGPWPASLGSPVAMHICKARSCSNGEHLVWGDLALNRDRAKADKEAKERLWSQRGLKIRRRAFV